jgi:ribose transport system permease protein
VNPRNLPAPARALAALALVLALGAIFNAGGTFFLPQTHRDLLGASSVTGILAVGMTLVVLTGGIDLSVGSALAFCGMTFTTLTLGAGWPTLPALAVTLLAGGAVGAVNGTLVGHLRLQPFIATLALMVVARGLAKYLPAAAGLDVGAKILPPVDASGIRWPPFYLALDGTVPGLGLPVVGVLFLASAALASFVVQRTVFGRHVLAVGGNEAASWLAGIAVRRVKLLAYTLCGALVAVAAVCQVARDRIGNPEAGTMYELRAIAAVVIGGTTLSGGRGGVWLTVVGVFTIGYIEKILSINNVQEHWRLVIQGAIIVLAVLLQERR